MKEPIHVLFSRGVPVAVQSVPFVLPEYGDKVSLTQCMYVPADQQKGGQDANHPAPANG